MNRRGFLGAFGVGSAVAVATGVQPERRDPMPQPTDQLRVMVDGKYHDVLVVPSKSPAPAVTERSLSGTPVRLDSLRDFVFSAPPNKITMRGPVTVEPRS